MTSDLTDAEREAVRPVLAMVIDGCAVHDNYGCGVQCAAVERACVVALLRAQRRSLMGVIFDRKPNQRALAFADHTITELDARLRELGEV